MPDSTAGEAQPRRYQRTRRRALVDEVRDLVAEEFIFNGAAEPGQLLPHEKELAERYVVSRVTLRAAMRSLQEAGLIISRHGVGWFVVADPGRLMQGLDQLSSLETFAHGAHKIVATAHLSWEETLADEQLARTLEVPLDHRILVVRRVKVLDGDAVGWLLDYVPEGVLPFDTLQEEFAGSILDILLTHREVGLEFADMEIHPLNLPEDISLLLGVEPGTAALFTDSIVRTGGSRVVEWAQGWLLPKHLRFHVRRRRHIGPIAGSSDHHPDGWTSMSRQASTGEQVDGAA